MRISFLNYSALALLLAANPAFASMRVTNLDTVAHTVEVSGNGAPERRTIGAGDTEYFTGQTSGMIALVDGAQAAKGKKKHDSVVHADGMLSGIIGNERDAIPADPDNDYAIWPGPHLNVQSRSRHGGRYF